MNANFRTMARRGLIGLTLAGSLSAGMLVPGGMASTTLGQDIREDRGDIRRDQRKLQHDVHKHGAYSFQARRDRADLRRDLRHDHHAAFANPR